MKPILFNTEMVRAILDGKKTVTRRAVKFDFIKCDKCNSEEADMKMHISNGDIVCSKCGRNVIARKYGKEFKNLKVPYQVGDILYVRETFGIHNCAENECIMADYINCNGCTHTKDGHCYIYKASHEYDVNVKWKPSIHMPKDAARIFLRVTDVKAERLQDMTCQDAWDEGARCNCMHPVSDCAGNKTAFIKVWNSTIKPSDVPSYGYDANPWVWVYAFERCNNPELLGGAS